MLAVVNASIGNIFIRPSRPIIGAASPTTDQLTATMEANAANMPNSINSIFACSAFWRDAKKRLTRNMPLSCTLTSKNILRIFRQLQKDRFKALFAANYIRVPIHEQLAPLDNRDLVA